MTRALVSLIEANMAERQRRRTFVEANIWCLDFRNSRNPKKCAFILVLISCLLTPVSGTKHTKDDCIGPLELFATFKMLYLCYFVFFKQKHLLVVKGHAAGLLFCFHDSFISTDNEVAQLHTLADWMRDEDLDEPMLLNTPPPPEKKSLTSLWTLLLL